MEPDATRDGLLSGLRAAADDLAGLCAEAGRAAWRRRPAPGEWSLTEIACHLRDVEREVHLERLRRVVAGPDVFLQAADPDPLAETRAYQEQDGPAAFRDFLAARAALIEYLEGLPPDTWERTARHALFGTTRFSELVSLMIDHDRAHIDQIRATLAVVNRPA